ncbi:unnamed protein product [Cunninghamella blakesleeana]
MTAQYTPMFNRDIEKQDSQKEQHQCPCSSSYQDQQNKKCSKLKLLTLGVIGLLFIGHSFGASSYRPHNTFLTSHEEPEIKTTSISPSSSFNNIVHLNDYVSKCSEESLHPWGGNAVYTIPQSIQHFKFGETAKNTIINLKVGNIDVVENKDLDETKVTLDIKLNDDTPEDFIRIEEEKTDDSYSLNIIHDRKEKRDNTCIQINALIEVPSSDALSSLILQFIDDKINVKDAFEFNDQLELSTVSGYIHTDKTLKATNIKVSNIGDNIQGSFDLNQNGEFTCNTVSGKADITFDHLSSDVVITSSTVSGQTYFKMPSNFESQFELTSTFGQVNVDATNTDLLHYKRTDRMFEKSVKGSYGEGEKLTSKITAKAVTGEISLNYQ